MTGKNPAVGTGDVYRQLARLLDTIPNGFPATRSGVELELLSRLFTPAQAALALQMKLIPEPVEQIAARAGGEPDKVKAELEAMVERGLIRAKERQGKVSYGLIPFVVGIYEEQLTRLDEELARLFEEYYQQAFHELLTVKPAMQRVIPVEQSVAVGIEVMPYESASALLGEAQSWGVMDCICRTQKKLLGEPCKHPVSVCMIFSQHPNVFDGSHGIRPVTKDEALAVLRQAEAAGLVHTVGNTQRGVYYICNCCTCSCAILRGVAQYGLLSAIAPSAFQARVDEKLCGGCELCLERCQFGALSMLDGVCKVDQRRCFGCGVCVEACGDSALTLVSRPPGEVKAPPPSMVEWMGERAASRGLDAQALEKVMGRLAERKPR